MPSQCSNGQNRRCLQGCAVVAYIATSMADLSGEHFSPHVTIGIGTAAFLEAMLAEPFTAFTFSPVSAFETSSRASEVTAQEHGPHLGRGPAYFATTNCPRTAPPGLFLLCTFT
jgi:hypothetical protein